MCIRDSFIGSGNRAKSLNATFVASYELKENLFVDATALLRNFKVRELATTDKTKLFSVGIRWNIGRREYDY